MTACSIQSHHGPCWLAFFGAVVAIFFGGCSRNNSTPHSAAADASPIQLLDCSDQTGITFVHSDGHGGQRYIVETVTGGMALFDYDQDGLIDIYFLNGAPLKGTDAGGNAPRNALYRNQGGFTFQDVTEVAGVGDEGFGLGVAVADFDNDGDPDLYLNNYGPNVLYRNEGDGTFQDVTATAGVGAGEVMGAGASFLDADGDGMLDLYVANYVDFTYDNHVTRARQGYPEYAGPREFPGVPDLLFKNNGDGTFTDVSEASGISQHTGTGMGIVAADYDNDNDTDLFVLNDVTMNFLFVNDGTGVFEERAVLVGAAFDGFGSALGSMGIDCGDFDNDGLLDFLMTSYQGEYPVLYKNMGNGTLEDVTRPTGIGEGSYPFVNWGVGLVDFDNDSDRDAFIACGHLQDQVDKYDDSTAYEVRNILMLNDGDETFTNVSDLAGDGLSVKRSSRGAVFDDLDNDGDVDAVILNSRRGPTILKNESPNDNHWIRIRLRGKIANRDGVGSHVLVTAGGHTQCAEVHSGRGYQSHFGLTLHFGLAKHTRVDRLEVRWLGGGREIFENVESDRLITVTEGTGITVEERAHDAR